jgi:hypothetical protein
MSLVHFLGRGGRRTRDAEGWLISPISSAERLSSLRVALHTLKHRDVTEIDRVLEWFVCLVTGFAFAICQSTKIDRMLEGNRLWSC